MTHIQTFPFNHYGVNTYILWDDTKKCVLVDVACIHPQEQEELKNFISKNALEPVALLLTHAHIDHIAGMCFAAETFQLPVSMHKDGMSFIETSVESGAMLGFPIDEQKLKSVKFNFIDEKDTIRFGNSQLTILHAPGHADGSLCYYCKEAGFVITGDVLFKQSIGRSDLPTGDYDLLIENIRKKLLVLPDETTVYPGHGTSTSIGLEKRQNPFLEGFQA